MNGAMQSRSPKAEGRKRAEIRSPKSGDEASRPGLPRLRSPRRSHALKGPLTDAGTLAFILTHILDEEMLESRRDSATKPRVARNELPWVLRVGTRQPQRGCVRRWRPGHNPVGVETWFARFPRVARRLATLCWRTQSLCGWPRLRSRLVGKRHQYATCPRW